MIKAFQFEEDGRTFTCQVEESRATGKEKWWWVAISGDQQRYAPFHYEQGDTERTLKPRIVAYYRDLLERRARPAVTGGHWSQRGKRPATPAAAAPAAPAEPAPAQN